MPLSESPRKTLILELYAAGLPRSRSPWTGPAPTDEASPRAPVRAPGLEGAVVADGHARAVARGAGAAELDEPGHPVAVAGVGGQQLEHAGVVGDPAGQRPADRLGEVVVAHGDRVRVAHGPPPALGGGPRADAGQRPQAAVRVRRAQSAGPLEPGGDLGGGDDRAGPDALDPGPVPVPRRDTRPPPGWREHPHPGRGGT